VASVAYVVEYCGISKMRVAGVVWRGVYVLAAYMFFEVSAMSNTFGVSLANTLL
jgi:hypothetical protein